MLTFTDREEMNREKRWEGRRQVREWGLETFLVSASSWPPVWTLPLCLCRGKHFHSLESRRDDSTDTTQGYLWCSIRLRGIPMAGLMGTQTGIPVAEWDS